ncbi:MAG TPA: hypothetical protein VET85_15750, partial [Stellaceae bacterium]|nr:hypothetical protein [Stellaceae bacterium]
MLEKIELRNIFDQYSQPENRITHALLTGLNLDRQLLGHFLRQLVRVKTPVTPTKLIVLEQQYPGEAEPREDELEKRGNPDGWIFDEDSDWCVFIESKVLMKPNAEQIRRHYGSAARRDFRRVTAVVIAPQPPANLGSDVVPLEWREVYRWLRSHAHEST